MPPPDHADYCRANAAPPGSGFYYASLFVAPEYRDRIVALHALEAEIENTLTASQDPGVVRMRLQWWLDELQRASAGNARHPVGLALQQLIAGGWLTAQELQTWLHAREAELGPPARHPDFAALLQAYIDAPGQLWRLSSHLCDVSDAHALAAAARLGGLHQLFRALQNSAADIHQGYCRAVPHNEWPNAAGQIDDTGTVENAHWQPLLRKQFQRLQTEMQSTLADCPIPLAAMAPHCPIMIGLDSALCREILRNDCAVLEKRYALTPVRKLWIAWRTRRKLRG